MRTHIAFALLSIVVVVPAVAAPPRATSVLPSGNAVNPYAVVTVNAGQPAKYLTLAGRRCDPVAQRDDAGAEVRIAGAQAAADDLRIVQFERPITEAQAAWLAARGIAAVGFIPDNGYIVRATAEDAAALEAQPGVRWVGAYAPEYRFGRRLLRALDGPAGKMPAISVRVFFAPSVTADAARKAVESLGAVEAVSATGDDLAIDTTLATERLGDLAAQPDVLVIEYRPRTEVHNNVAADVVDVRRMWDTHGFYGSNEIVAVADTGLDIGVTDSTVHLDFQDGAGHSRVLAIQDILGDGGSDQYRGHGTLVAGSVLGNGQLSGSDPTNNYFPPDAYVGMAPKALLYFQAMGSNNAAAGQEVYPPSNLTNLYGSAYAAGARIHLDSWGKNVNGDYNVDLNARDTDLYCFRHPEMLIVCSAGNEGTDVAAPLGVVDPGQISSPSLAKNVLSVGASENYRPAMTMTWRDGWPTRLTNAPIGSDRVADHTNGMAGFSSRGPCSDGRIKPDIVAPGTYIASTKAHTTTATNMWGGVPGNTNYAYRGGTSMAGALVAGAAAVLREYLRVDRGFTNPPAALVKAALLCGALDMAPGQYGTGTTQEMATAPNSVEGWGRLSLEGSLYQGSSYRMEFRTNAFTGAATFSSTVTVFDASHPLKAILAWTDIAGSAFGLNETYAWMAGGGLVNDLDLRVIDPLGVTNYPVAMNPRLDLFYYTNTVAQGYNSPVGMYEAEKCAAPGTPLTITRIYQILYDTTGAGGSYGTFIWDAGGGGMPGAVLFAETNTVPAGGAGFKYRSTVLGSPVTITGTTFFIGSQLLSANLIQVRDTGIGSASSPRTYSTWTGSWTQDNDPDTWIHACGTVSNGDHMNTVEGVIITNPAAGVYRILVSGNNVPHPPVRYGLAVSGGLAEGGIDQTITFPPISDQTVTSRVGLAATASSGLPVSFAVGSGPGSIAGATNLTFTGAGSVSIVASQAGDATYDPAPDVTNTFHVFDVFTVTVASAHGSTVPETGDYSVVEGTVMTNRVSALDIQGTTQHVCTGWSMAGNEPQTGVDTQCVVTVTNDCVLTWLWDTYYWLDTEAGPHGAVNVSDGWQMSLVTTQITALPDTYYHFTNWTGSAGGTSNPLYLLMDEAKMVMANFAATWTTNRPTPHWWLAQYGITDSFETAVGEDPDDDGVPTGDEFVMDTDPTNGASYLRIEQGDVIPLAAVYFESSSNRVYSLSGCTSLTVESWGAVPGAGPRAGVGGTDALSDTNEPPKGPFYRLGVELE